MTTLLLLLQLSDIVCARFVVNIFFPFLFSLIRNVNPICLRFRCRFVPLDQKETEKKRAALPSYLAPSPRAIEMILY